MPWKRENKNTIMKLWHPFMPKQVGKGREREKKKIVVPLRSYPTRNWKFQKNSKKIKKVKKYHYGFISSQESVAKGGERDKIKSIVTFRSYSTRNLKFQKNCNKIQKIKIYHYGFVSSENRLEKAKKEKNKNYRSVPFLHDA